MLEQGTIPFAVASASPEYEPYCQQVLKHALDNQPMDPTVYRFAFYLYGKVKLAWAAGHRLVKGAGSSAAKRGKSDDMTGTRYMIFPVRADPSMPAQVASECMMVASEEIEENVKYEAFALEAQDPPGLAILDSGCTRTMHGSEWAHRFEEEISKYDLVPKVRDKRQTFKGIGGAAESKIVKSFPSWHWRIPWSYPLCRDRRPDTNADLSTFHAGPWNHHRLEEQHRVLQRAWHQFTATSSHSERTLGH